MVNGNTKRVRLVWWDGRVQFEDRIVGRSLKAVEAFTDVVTAFANVAKDAAPVVRSTGLLLRELKAKRLAARRVSVGR